MEHLDFVLWMLLYPLTTSISNFLSIKGREMVGKKPHSDATIGGATLVELIVLIVIGILLY